MDGQTSTTQPAKAGLSPLVALATPIAFSHMANAFMQLVDTYFVGKISPEALGGVSLGSGIFSILMMVGIGVLLGLDYRISHAYGAKKYEDCQKYLVHGFYLALFFAIPLIVILYMVSYHFQDLGIQAAVAEQAGSYTRTLAISMLPFLLFSACRQYLQATGTAGPILAIYIVANLLNALGNWVFITGHWGLPAMGVAGAGVSTTVARTLMFLMVLAYTLWRNHRLDFSMRRAGLKFQSAIAHHLLGLGLPASGQLILEIGVFVAATFLIGRLGPIALAAHQIVLQIAGFTFMMPMGISAAAAVVVGQQLGAGSPRNAVHQGWLAIGLGAVIMSVSAATLFIFNHFILGIFTSSDAVLSIARNLLLLATFFQIFDGIQVVAIGSLRGAASTRASMIANLVGHWFIGLPVGATLCFVMGWGATGIWTGLTLGLAVVSVVLLVVWKKKTASLLALEALST
jgi:MATE family multidrug resistance protein